MDTDAVKKGLTMIENGISMLRGGPMDYYLKQLLAARDLLLTRFAPFKVGDRVTLRRAYDPKEFTGWSHSKHFLIPGSPATVQSSDCSSEGDLIFDLVFDNESWIDDKGVERPVSEKHSYRFSEVELKAFK